MEYTARGRLSCTYNDRVNPLFMQLLRHSLFCFHVLCLGARALPRQCGLLLSEFKGVVLSWVTLSRATIFHGCIADKTGRFVQPVIAPVPNQAYGLCGR